MAEDKDTQKSIIQEHEENESSSSSSSSEEEEFSFFCEGINTSPITPEDAFINGQIKPIYPLFNQELLLEQTNFAQNFPMNPQVKKVFVEVSGPCRESSEKPGTDPEGCKKSNSTGFSRLRRFKNLLHRSNSDGRDAFVFLNDNKTTSLGQQIEEEEKVKKGKKKKKKKTASSAHQVYLKNKAKENDRRKSYLPYRPEMFGFFTNVNGGMSKNVHPF